MYPRCDSEIGLKDNSILRLQNICTLSLSHINLHLPTCTYMMNMNIQSQRKILYEATVVCESRQAAADRALRNDFEFLFIIALFYRYY